MAAGLLSLCLLIGVAVVARKPIAQLGAMYLLKTAGIQVRGLEITQVAFDHLRIENVSLGGENGPSAKQLDIEWTAETLAEARVARISIVEPNLSLKYADGRINVDGLDFGGTKSAAPGALPFDRMHVSSANVSYATPWGQGKLSGDAEIAANSQEMSLSSAHIVSASIAVAGGAVSVADIDYQAGKPTVGVLKIDQIDLKSLLALVDIDDANGQGGVSGEIPFRLYLSDTGMDFVRLEVDAARLSVETKFGSAELIGDIVVVSSPTGVAPARGRLASATMDVFGGRLSLAKVDFVPDRPVEAILNVENVDLQTILEMIDVDGLSGSGSITGNIPIRLDENGVGISGGRMVSTGPGILRYSGAALPQNLPGDDKRATDSVALARDALADFHYTGLGLGLNRAASGEGTLTVKMEGANPRVLDNHPFVLNIRLDANFDKLAQILLDGYAKAEELMKGSGVR